MASPAENQMCPLKTTEEEISDEIIANFSIVYRIFLRRPRKQAKRG